MSIMLGCSGTKDPSKEHGETVGSGGTSSSGEGGEAATGGGSGSGGETRSGGAGEPSGPPEFDVLGVTTFRNNADAAYSIVHDDACAPEVDHQLTIASPELAERGLRATFGTIGQQCVSRPGLMNDLQGLRDQGHEIANHTFDHQDLSAIDLDAAKTSVDQGQAALEDHLKDFKATFFLFPYDAFSDDVVAHLQASGYLGARAGLRGHNSADFDDPFRLNFDVYGPGYSIYAGSPGTPCAAVGEGDSWDTASEACRSFTLTDYVDEVIADGGYGIRELHSVEGEAWEPVPRVEYEAHLDYLEGKVASGELWVDTVSEVIRYRFAREKCSLPTSKGRGLTFGSPSAECTKYATALTYRIQAKAGTKAPIRAKQGKKELVLVPDGDAWFLTVDLSLGPAFLE